MDESSLRAMASRLDVPQEQKQLQMPQSSTCSKGSDWSESLDAGGQDDIEEKETENEEDQEVTDFNMFKIFYQLLQKNDTICLAICTQEL